MLNISINTNESGSIEQITVQSGNHDKPLTINTTKTIAATKHATRFVDNGDGTITDHELNLMWSKDDISKKELKHAAAAKECATLELAGFNDWRLPERRELASLVDDTRFNPAIDINAFPYCRSTWYWTNSPLATTPDDCAWIVAFYYGNVHGAYRDGTACVRAVRSVSPSQ